MLDKLAAYETKHLFKLIDELNKLEEKWWELSQATYGFSIDVSIAESQVHQKEQVILDTIRAFKYVHEYQNGESKEVDVG